MLKEKVKMEITEELIERVLDMEDYMGLKNSYWKSLMRMDESEIHPHKVWAQLNRTSESMKLILDVIAVRTYDESK